MDKNNSMLTNKTEEDLCKPWLVIQASVNCVCNFTYFEFNHFIIDKTTGPENCNNHFDNQQSNRQPLINKLPQHKWLMSFL